MAIINIKKIFIIGKNGQLGTALAKDASLVGFNIVSFNRDEMDITDASQVKEKLENNKPDVLINTAAYHVLSQCEENPLKAMEVNFVAVGKMAKLCKNYNIKFITYSTDYVFDGEKKEPYKEDNQQNPLQVYGISKLAGEYAALNFYPEGAYVIRTCGLYGGEKGSPDKGGNFILNIIKEAQIKDIIEVSCEQYATPTYAKDLSEATLKLLKNNAEPGIYHLINEDYCSWYEFTREIYKLINIHKEVKPVHRGGISGGMRRPKFSVLENRKAKKLGIELPSWQNGLRRYLENELKYKIHA